MSVSGNWKVTMNTPMGPRPADLSLSASGADLSGKFSGEQGGQDFTGKADGNHVEWSFTTQGPMGPLELTFKGDVDGDAISGNVQFGSFGSGTFTGTRA